MSYHMRRKELEIKNPATLKKILKSAKYITIALAKDNEPYLVSLSHGYDEANNCIYFHCANEGKKLDYLNSNNVVWGQALLDGGYQEDECNHFFATTQFRGKVTFLKDDKDKQKAAECMIKQLNKKPRKMIAETTPEKLKKTTFCRIDINYLSGKKHGEMTI
jgi:nitroimidazol reductase NimA-like FMN-containing flavoprotein (pyridoxamine 5'-phosphate oxidase superfamily)